VENIDQLYETALPTRYTRLLSVYTVKQEGNSVTAIWDRFDILWKCYTHV